MKHGLQLHRCCKIPRRWLTISHLAGGPGTPKRTAVVARQATSQSALASEPLTFEPPHIFDDSHDLTVGNSDGESWSDSQPSAVEVACGTLGLV